MTNSKHFESSNSEAIAHLSTYCKEQYQKRCNELLVQKPHGYGFNDLKLANFTNNDNTTSVQPSPNDTNDNNVPWDHKLSNSATLNESNTNNEAIAFNFSHATQHNIDKKQETRGYDLPKVHMQEPLDIDLNQGDTIKPKPYLKALELKDKYESFNNSLPKAHNKDFLTNNNCTPALKSQDDCSYDNQSCGIEVSSHKDNDSYMKKEQTDKYNSDVAEVAKALGLSLDVIAKGMGTSAKANQAKSTNNNNSDKNSSKSITKGKSSSKSDKLRQYRTLEIMTSLGMVVSQDNYDTYCELIKKEDLVPYSKDMLVAMMVCNFFSKDGTLSKNLDNYNPRLGQIEFADSVVRAMANKDLLIVEAGTGTGKTFSYLVPPLLAGKKILISTKTKALQDQLITKDIPNLIDMMELNEVHAISLKGQSNYICRYLLENAKAIGEDRRVIAKLNEHSYKCSIAIDKNARYANFGEINIKLPEQLRPMVSCDSFLCHEMSKNCPYAYSKKEYLKKGMSVIQSAVDKGHDLNQVMRNLDSYEVDDINSEHCFSFAARQEAKKRDISVINHALFFASLKSDLDMGSFTSSLPLPDVLVFDEAHTLSDVGCEFYKTEFNGSMIIDLIEKIRGSLESGTKSGDFKLYLEKLGYCSFLLNLGLSLMPEGKHSVSTVKYLHQNNPSPFQLLKHQLAEHRTAIALLEDSYYMAQVNKGLLEAGQKILNSDELLENNSETSLLPQTLLDDELSDDNNLNKESHNAFDIIMGLEDKKEQRRHKREKLKFDTAFERKIKALYQKIALDHHKAYGYDQGTSKNNIFNEYDDVLYDNQGLPLVDPYFRALMADMHKVLGNILDLWQNNEELIEEGFEDIKSRIIDYQTFISEFMTSDRNKKQEECFDNAAWIEVGNDHSAITLVVCPIDIKDKFYNAMQMLKEKGVTVVLTSATITSNKSFGKFCHELGLNAQNITTKIVESPFNYAKNSCLYLSDKFPDVKSANFIKDSISMIDELITKATGGIFMLCTSFANMKIAKEELTRRYGYSRNIFMQNEDAVPVLIDKFKKDGKAILIGTASFWEGVDVPGNALSLVIIDKLPFKQIGDPLQLARKNKVERFEKGNYFAQVQVPETIIALRQGAGRLIRNESDQGVLVILDKRLLGSSKSSYANQCINSLPPMTRVDTIASALKYFKKV